MTIKSYTQLKTDIAAALPDTGASQISPADVRVGMVDIVDTMQSVSALFPPLKTPVVQAAMISSPALSGMTATATTGATIAFDANAFGGIGGMTITPTAASVVVKRGMTASPQDWSTATTIQIGINNNYPAGADKVLLICYFSNDLASDWAIFNLDLRGSPVGKDVCLSINKATRSNQSGTYNDAMWSSVKGFGFTQSSQTVDANNYFSVSNIVAAKRYIPSVFISMDHGYNGQMKLGIPTLEKYRLNGGASIFLRADTLGGGGVYTDLATIQSVNAAGYPVGLHSYTKLLDTTNLTNFPTAQSITDEINAFHTWAATNNITTFRKLQCIAVADPFIGVLTQAQAQSRTDGYFNAGVTRLRRGNQGYNVNRVNNDGFLKGSIVHTFPLVAATTNANIDAWLQIALDRQELISVYVHNILASGATGNDCNLTQFDYLCSRIAAFRSTGQMTIAQPSDLV